jgi:hypothetical protein
MKRTFVAAGLMAAVLTMATGCGKTKSTATTASTAAPAATTATTPAATVPPTTPAPTVPPTTLSLQEQNAIQAAQQYLSMGSGFSLAGLIQQMSSSAGDGYPVAIATAAVNSLNVNWDAQAVVAAKGYLQTTSFSCANMVQQLDSAAGSQFTVAQAQHGAKAVGIC